MAKILDRAQVEPLARHHTFSGRWDPGQSHGFVVQMTTKEIRYVVVQAFSYWIDDPTAPGSDTVKRQIPGGYYVDKKFRVIRNIPIDHYVNSLYASLEVERDDKRRQKIFEATRDLTLTIAALVFPESILFRYVTPVALAMNAFRSLQENRFEVFIAQELIKLFIQSLFKVYIPISSPQVILKVGKHAAAGLEHLSDSSIDAFVEIGFSSLSEQEAELSPTLIKILSIHRLRMRVDPGYVAGLKRIEKISRILEAQTSGSQPPYLSSQTRTRSPASDQAQIIQGKSN